MFRIIYLHGFASSPQSKKAQLFRERFATAGSQISILDLDDGNFENLTITGQLRVIDAAVAGKPAALVGSSLGGYLAALYASRHPEIERLVLMAPGFGFSHLWPESLDAEAVEEWKRTGFLSVFHYGDNRERRLSYGIVEDARQYPDFPDFSQPALIYHGSQDTVVPPERSERFAASHPNAMLRIVESGHDLMSAIDEILRGAEEFLSQ
jgi:pimeloyl-ACP methyl ester carboxylesterase